MAQTPPQHRQLNASQMAAAREYARTNNAVAAYLSAGYAEGKTTAATARRAWTYFHNADALADEVARQRVTLAKHVDVANRRIMAEIGAVAFSSVQRLFDETGALIPIENWDEATARAVKSVTVTRRIVQAGDGVKPEIASEAIKIVLHDKMAGLRLISEIKGMTAATPPPEVRVIVRNTGRSEE